MCFCNVGNWAKSVTFDCVEVLEFSEADDEEVPDQLPETEDNKKYQDILPFNIS